jgi:hypothetical protein
LTEFDLDQEHFKYFRDVAQPGAWSTGPLRSWLEDLGLFDLVRLSEQPQIGRPELKEMAKDPAYSDRDVLWAILGWGKMHRQHARRFKENEQAWLNVVQHLRTGNLTRADGYALCHDTMCRITNPGIGPAYFTKLIFFADPKHDGYIMDQWTARTSNLLVIGSPLVRMQSREYVSPHNSPNTYERFCQLVEYLAKMINRSSEETEQCMFSKGGKKPDPWRKFVRDNDGKVQEDRILNSTGGRELSVNDWKCASLHTSTPLPTESNNKPRKGKKGMTFSPEAVARVLIPIAMRKQTITYKDLGIALGRTDRAPWRGLGKTLYGFQDWIIARELPPLSLLVVNKASRRPSANGQYKGVTFSAMSDSDIQKLQEECFTFTWPQDLLGELGIE